MVYSLKYQNGNVSLGTTHIIMGIPSAEDTPVLQHHCPNDKPDREAAQTEPHPICVIV